MSSGSDEAAKNRRRGALPPRKCTMFGCFNTVYVVNGHCDQCEQTSINKDSQAFQAKVDKAVIEEYAALQLSAANAGLRKDPQQATKHDSGKPKLSFVSRELMEELAKVREFGAKKYQRNDWMKGFKYTRSIDAALRHLMAINSGENIDEESQCYHAACVIANMEHLLHDMLYRPQNDDRDV